MLDVIGAGATATTAQDWYGIWQTSPEASVTQDQIDAIHTEGRSRPAVETALHSEFATPWFVQVKELFVREAQAYWRDPTYLMAKFALNIIAGLFVGFTFYKSKDTQQGTQNKLFAIFMITIIRYARPSLLLSDPDAHILWIVSPSPVSLWSLSSIPATSTRSGNDPVACTAGRRLSLLKS